MLIVGCSGVGLSRENGEAGGLFTRQTQEAPNSDAVIAVSTWESTVMNLSDMLCSFAQDSVALGTRTSKF